MPRRPHGFAPRLVLALALLFTFAAPQSPAQKLLNNNAAAFSNLEQEMIQEINLARTGPAGYAAFLEQTRPHFAGKEFRRPGQPTLNTVEGLDALEEAIRFLRSSKPLPPLEVSPGMCSGALALVSDQGATGATGHKGSDGSFCEGRVERFGSWTGAIGENLSYGTETARERIITLIIDDGFSNRGHRARIFDPRFKVAGVACGTHKEGPLCVVTFAGGFTERPKAKQPARAESPTRGKRQPPAGATQF
jgi:uncharacterized protein YkwD